MPKPTILVKDRQKYVSSRKVRVGDTGDGCCCNEECWREAIECITDEPSGKWIRCQDMANNGVKMMDVCYYFGPEQPEPGGPGRVAADSWIGSCAECEFPCVVDPDMTDEQALALCPDVYGYIRKPMLCPCKNDSLDASPSDTGFSSTIVDHGLSGKKWLLPMVNFTRDPDTGEFFVEYRHGPDFHTTHGLTNEVEVVASFTRANCVPPSYVTGHDCRSDADVGFRLFLNCINAFAPDWQVISNHSYNVTGIGYLQFGDGGTSPLGITWDGAGPSIYYNLSNVGFVARPPDCAGLDPGRYEGFEFLGTVAGIP